MVRNDEMAMWRYREVAVTLSVRECKLIHDSITRFAKEYSEKKQDVFREGIASKFVLEDARAALEFFSQLMKNNTHLQELNSLIENEAKRNDALGDETSEFSLESDDPFGFNVASQISEVGSKGIPIEIALLPLISALKISDAYEQEMNYRKNDEISSQEVDDWSPPSNFANGNDAEREIWDEYQRNQKLRK